MRERLLAVLGAICLVAVAVLVRSAFLGDDGGSSGGDGPSDDPSDIPVVACSPTVSELCDALAAEGAIAADPPTLELGDDVPAEVDGWIAWDPGPAVAGFSSDAQAPEATWPRVQGLATAPIAVAGTEETLAAACQAATWACLAEASADVAISVGEPTSDEGLARIEPLAQALTEGEIDQIAGPVTDLLRGPVSGQSTAADGARDLATRPGAIDLVVGPEALLRREASSPRGQDRRLRVVVPDKAATATVVLAARSGDLDGAKLCDVLADDGRQAVAASLDDLGVEVRCTAKTMADGRSGFLYQVKERA